jgi:hypothetical protein
MFEKSFIANLAKLNRRNGQNLKKWVFWAVFGYIGASEHPQIGPEGYNKDHSYSRCTVRNVGLKKSLIQNHLARSVIKIGMFFAVLGHFGALGYPQTQRIHR